MFKNQALEIYNNSPKIYRIVTKKNFVSFMYFLLFILMSIGLGFLIFFLVSNQDNKIFGYTGISICAIDIIIFYIFHFYRKKSKYYFTDKFSFKNLYESNLANAKIIDMPNAIKNSNDIKSYNEFEIFKQYKYSFSRLGNKFNNIWIKWNDKDIFLSYCNIVIYKFNDKNDLKRNIEKNNFILRTNIKINIDCFITSKKYDLKKIENINFRKKINNTYLYTNSKSITKFNSQIKKISELNKIGVDCEIRILNKEIYYYFETDINFLLLNMDKYKFFKNGWNNIFNQYDLDFKKMQKIIKIIQ